MKLNREEYRRLRDEGRGLGVMRRRACKVLFALACVTGLTGAGDTENAQKYATCAGLLSLAFLAHAQTGIADTRRQRRWMIQQAQSAPSVDA